MKPYPARIALVVTMFFVTFACKAQFHTVAVKKSMPDIKAEGIFYSLSRNVIKIDVTIEKTSRYKGPYADYAQKYLGINNVITENKSTYDLELVNLTVMAERDPEHTYFIEIPSKSKSLPPLALQFNEEGVLGGMQFNISENSSRQASQPMHQADFIEQLQPSVLEKTDTIIRRISVDTTTIEERFVRRSVSEKTTEQQAKDAAALIRKIEENKFNLLTGYQEINYSRDALDFMLNQLDSLKNEYLDLFKGKVVKTYEYHTFSITPSASSEGTLETICRFSPEVGLVEKSSFKGEPLSVKVVTDNDSPALDQFLKSRENVSRRKTGIFYRIPRHSRISIIMGEHEIAGLQTQISQMGSVTFLPARGLSGVKFHPVSGALILLSIN